MRLHCSDPIYLRARKTLRVCKTSWRTRRLRQKRRGPQENEYQSKVQRLNELNFLLSKKDDQPQLGLEQPHRS